MRFKEVSARQEGLDKLLRGFVKMVEVIMNSRGVGPVAFGITWRVHQQRGANLSRLIMMTVRGAGKRKRGAGELARTGRVGRRGGELDALGRARSLPAGRQAAGEGKVSWRRGGGGWTRSGVGTHIGRRN